VKKDLQRRQAYPGIDVADGSTGQDSASDGSANLGDVADEVGRVGPDSALVDDASGGIAVEILTAM